MDVCASERSLFRQQLQQQKLNASLLHQRLAGCKGTNKQIQHMLKRQQAHTGSSRLGYTVKLMLAMAARKDPVLAQQLKRQLLREVQTVVEVSRSPKDPSCAGLLRQLSSGILVEVLDVYHSRHNSSRPRCISNTSSSSSSEDNSSCDDDTSSSGYDSDGGSSLCSDGSIDTEDISKMLEDALVTAATKAQATGHPTQQKSMKLDVEAVMQMELHQCLQSGQLQA